MRARCADLGSAGRKALRGGQFAPCFSQQTNLAEQYRFHMSLSQLRDKR